MSRATLASRRRRPLRCEARIAAAADAVRARVPRAPGRGDHPRHGAGRAWRGDRRRGGDRRTPTSRDFPLSTVESHAGRLLCGTLGGQDGGGDAGAVPPLRGLLAAAGHASRARDARAGRDDADRVQRLRRHESRVGGRRPDADRRPHQPAGRQSAHRAQRRRARPALSRHVSAVRPGAAGAGARRGAGRTAITLREGVYVAVAGPNLETRAEYRMLRATGRRRRWACRPCRR